MPYLTTFVLKSENTIIVFEIRPSNLSNRKVWCKIKNSSMWDQKCLIRVFLPPIWNQHPRICRIAKFGAKMKILKFETAYVLSGYFKAGIWKHYCHFWNQYSCIFLYAKFHAKIKILRFRTKIPLFEYFWAGIWKTIVIFEINNSRIFLKTKFFEKMKIFKSMSKNAFFEYFYAGTWKYYCHIWNQRPRICLTLNAFHAYLWAGILENYYHI